MKVNTFEENIKLLTAFNNNTSYTKLHRLNCSVCGQFSIVKTLNKTDDFYHIDFLYYFKDQLNYKNLPDYKEFETAFLYNGHFSKLNNLVLDQMGFYSGENKVFYFLFNKIFISNNLSCKVAICNKCYMSLRRDKIPPNAIINHYSGQIPEALKGLTVIEELLLSQYHLKAKIFKIYGHYYETQLKIIGNVISFQQSFDDLLKILPDTNQLDAIRVIFVGTRLKKKELQRIFKVRQSKVKEALEWLIKHNTLYSLIKINDSELKKLPHDDIPTQLIFDFIDKDLDNEEQNNNLDLINKNDYLSVEAFQAHDFFTSVIINSNEPNEQHLNDQINDLIYVKRGKIPIQEYNNNKYLLGNYPCLFPFGVGSYTNPKIDKISFREYILGKMLSTNPNFRENKTFMFCTFNILQRQESRIHRNIFCKRKHFDFLKAKISTLTEESLGKLKLDLNKNISLKTNSIEFKILKKVFYGMSKVQGSRSALYDRRQDIYSYMMFFGLPHFWITINPSDTNNPLFFFICGEHITSDFFLEDNYKNRMKILAKNPFCQALFFDKLYTHFLEDLICYGKQNGILGDIVAYYVMLEAQGRGSLHGHGLYWLENMLCAEQFKSLIKTKYFYDKLIYYLDHTIFCDLENLEPFKNQNDSNINVLSETLDFLDLTEPTNVKFNCLSKAFSIAKKTQYHKCTANCFINSVECKRGFGVKGIGKDPI